MILLLLVLFFSNDPKTCFELIKDGKIHEASIQFKSIQPIDSDYYKINKAYFSRNAVQATEVYKELYETAKILEIKLFAQKKLYEYYFASGLYKKAELYKIVDINDTTVITSTNENIQYTIQMGVFSAESNALALKQKIHKIIKDRIKLKKELREGKSVIVVNVGSYKTRETALLKLNNLRDHLGLSGWIKEIN